MKRARLVRRLAHSALALFVLSLGVFAVLHMIPGGPFDHAIQDGGASAEDLRRVEALLGLDRPPLQRYGHWLAGWLGGDWGRSWSVAMQEPVRGLVLGRLGRSALLAGLAIGAALAGSLALAGLLSRKARGSTALLAGLTALHSVPGFCTAVLALWAAGSLGLSVDGAEGMGAYILWPALVLALFRLNEWTRLFLTEIEGILAQPYILMARAKGVAHGRLLLSHVLPNLLPVVGTVLALDLPALVSGALVVEAVFNYPGLGLLAHDAVQASDWPVVQSIALLTGLAVALSNAAADGLRWALDPRLRDQP